MIAGNIPDRPSFVGINGERWKRAWVEHFRDLRFNVAVTLSWNRSLPLEIGRRHLSIIHAMVDKKLFGRRFDVKPKAERTSAVFVFEGVGPGGHLHAHSLWRLRDRDQVLPFARLFPGERGGHWNKVAKAGSYKVNLAEDWSAFAGYALKDQHMSSDCREIVWSDEFYPT
jgi:hypothetical protein